MERNRGKQRRNDGRDHWDRTRDGGGFGGGGKNGEGGDHHHRRIVTAVWWRQGRRVGCWWWLRAPSMGKRWRQPGQWPQLWRRQRGAEKRRERTFSVGRLVNLLLLVFDFEHGPRRGGRGSRQEVPRAIPGGASGPEAFTLLLRLSRSTSTWSTRGRATLSCIFLECVTARHFLIPVGCFAYLCRPLWGVSMFSLRGRMWC